MRSTCCRSQGPGPLGLFADQFLDRDRQGAGEPGKERGWHLMAADFVGGDDLLGNLQFLGELGLGPARWRMTACGAERTEIKSLQIQR